MYSSASFGRLTPVRWNTNSASLQYLSKSDGSVSISYLYISYSGGENETHKFFPTKPFAPVTNIFISKPPHLTRRGIFGCSPDSTAFLLARLCSTCMCCAMYNQSLPPTLSGHYICTSHSLNHGCPAGRDISCPYPPH